VIEHIGGRSYAAICFGLAVQVRPLCDVCKTAILILPTQLVPMRRIARRESRGRLELMTHAPAVHEEDVQQPVIVVIEQCHNAAHGFDQLFL
jgi:hypothetical protein